VYFKRPLLYLLTESTNRAGGRIYTPRLLSIDAILRPTVLRRASIKLPSIRRILGN